MLQLLSSPRRYTPGMDKKALWFRHPWVIDGKKGKLIRIGIATLSREDQGKLFDDLSKLLDKSPKTRSDAPAVDRRVLDPYLALIKSATPREYALDITTPMRLSVTDKESGDEHAVDLVTPLPTQDHMNMFLPPKGVSIEKFAAAYQVSKAIKDELRRKDEALAAERRENERLKSVIERMGRTMGEKSDDEKKLKVGECLKHFEKTFRVQEGVSEGQRDDVLRRVKVVLEKLGHEKHYVRITENDLIAAVTASGPKTLRERSKRIQYIKRFCTWLCRSPEKGGLGFVGNPGSDLKAEGEKAIQAKRRATGKVSTLDPKPLMGKLPLYWRTFLAVMGYAGLRRGEAAGLTWDAVDFENRIIHVRANKFYQQLKTELSERPVPPFQELWKILEDHRKAVTHPELVSANFPDM